MAKRHTPVRRTAARLAAPALLALCLAGCAAGGRFGVIEPDATIQPQQQAAATPVNEREHARILAAYGGQYDNPPVEAMLNQTVEKLVAASERPDLRYNVTILNSPSINA